MFLVSKCFTLIQIKLREDQALNLLPILPSVVFFLSLTAQTEIVFVGRFSMNVEKKNAIIASILLQVGALIINYLYPNPAYFAWAGMAYALYCLNLMVRLEQIYHAVMANALQFFNVLAILVSGVHLFYFYQLNSQGFEPLKPLPVAEISIFGSGIILSHMLIQTICLLRK